MVKVTGPHGDYDGAGASFLGLSSHSLAKAKECYGPAAASHRSSSSKSAVELQLQLPDIEVELTVTAIVVRARQSSSQGEWYKFLVPINVTNTPPEPEPEPEPEQTAPAPGIANEAESGTNVPEAVRASFAHMVSGVGVMSLMCLGGVGLL